MQEQEFEKLDYYNDIIKRKDVKNKAEKRISGYLTEEQE
jgi:hypothetical protein